jgi:hypothetical protein
LVDGKPTVTKQSYVDYIKDTHTFPVSSTGELLRPLNKAVFPDTEDFIKKSVSLVPGVQPEPKPIAPKPVEVKPVVPVVDSNSETLYTASHKDIIEYTENSPVAQSLGLHSLFKQGGMFYDKAAYEQALQSINDNPNVVYQVVVREVKEGKGIKAKQVPYSPSIEGDFILAIIPTDKAGIPVILLRKEDAELAGIDLSKSPMSITGSSSENFVSTSKTAPAPALTAPVSTDAKANIHGRIAEQGTSIELEIKGKTSKEFLLVIDRNGKGKIELYSEKKEFPDGPRFSQGEGRTASQEQIKKLYDEYIPKKTQEAINNWLNSFTGSWAAPETQDGKNYDKAEKELNTELAALGQSTPTITPRQSLINSINNRGQVADETVTNLFGEDEVQEAQKAKEDCINPAKQVKDQIKKKPKL